MATRNKPTPKPAPPLDEDGFLCLKGEHLWKWRALDAELRTALVEMESVKSKIAAAISKHPEIGSLMSKQVEMFGVIATARAELATVHADIEEQFDVKLKECAFDDRTGRLYTLTNEGERGEPMKQKKVKRHTR